MIAVHYTHRFLRELDRLETDLQAEVQDKVDFFKDPEKHLQLKVHKLHGRLSKCYSFSVNYRYRIMFEYISKKEVVLLTIGDHDVYK